MTASDHLGPQFHSVRVPAEEHAQAVAAAQTHDPAKNWSVSAPEEHTQSFAVRDQNEQTHGYYSLKSAGRNTRYLGGLVNTSGAPGVGKHVLARTQRRNVKLDAFSGPLEGYYKARGFQTTDRMTFDDKYAPSSWKPDYGRSDVIEMESKKK